MQKTARSLAALLSIFAIAPSAHAEADFDFDAFSLEELTSLEVTTAAKRPQRVSDTASAIFVVTAEDIRRGGYTSVPEALRLVPGMHVERNSSATWSISARGFESVFANKLLVLVDGRSVYTNLFAGTFWDAQTPAIDDIDRIEVIRGPGATLWGANAVNGVINIITKSADRALGSRVAVRAGNKEQFGSELRHGLKLGEEASIRFSGSLNHQEGAVDRDRHEAADDNEIGHLNSRLDWTPNERDTIQLNLNGYDGQHEQDNLTFRPDFSDAPGTRIRHPERYKGTSANTVWRHEISESNSVELSGYYNRETRAGPLVAHRDRTFDLGFQQNLRPTDSQQIVWGAGWRLNDSRVKGTPALDYTRASDSLAQYNVFAQDEIVLTRSVQFTAGSKVSWNEFTGWEVQPSARALWKPTAEQSVWAAASRAVRTPARGERDGVVTAAAFRLPFPPFTAIPVQFRGDSDLESEVLMAYELGYRTELTSELSIDTALFAHDYNHLLVPTSNGLIVNSGEEHSLGAEISFNWFPLQRTRIHGSWSTIHRDNAESTPAHIGQLHTAFDLTSQIELDLGAFYRGRRTQMGLTPTKVSSHIRTDLRIGWNPTKRLSFSLVGQDLFSSPHLENSAAFSATTEIERSVYLQTSYAF